MNNLNDKIIVVTGGASGIGKELCLALAKEKAVVIIADINLDSAFEVSEEIKKNGTECMVIKTDVAVRESIKSLIDVIIKEFGRIDIMINNAGIGIDGEFQDLKIESWKNIVDINLWGVIYGTNEVYPIMMEQGFGQIVNVSSLAGLLPGGLMTSYSATKHAVTGFSLGLRGEASQYGIKVNALCPGFIETPIHDSTQKVTNYLNLEKNQRNKNFFPTADACVDTMIKGIKKNKAIIISPLNQIVIWWLYRLFPTLIPYLWMKIIKKLKS